MNIMRFVVPKSLVEYVTVDNTVRQALEKMRFHRYAAIPVIDESGAYVGTLRNDDIFAYFLDSGAFDSRSAEKDKVAKITKEQVKEIATLKMPDLNAASLESAMSMIAGTARSMGVVVED